MQRSILIVALGAGLAFGFSRAAQAQATGAEKTAAEALSKLETVGFGWWGPQAHVLTLYLDDIAAAATRIGCN